MSTTEQEKKRPSRRLRKPREGDLSSDNSGSESDTIFEEASDYESAEDQEPLEGAPKQRKELDVPHQQEFDNAQDIKETVELAEKVAALNVNSEPANEEADERKESFDGDQPNEHKEESLVENQEIQSQPDVNVEGEDVEGEDVEGEDVEGEDVEGEDVEGEDVEGEDVEGEDVEGEDVEGGDVEDAEDGDEQSENEETDDALEEKRGSGDGQEEPAEGEVELDDDEDLKNPAYIPRRGAYYQHDVRNDDQKGDKRQKRDRRLWKEDGNKWLHDKFDEEEQGPKSCYELMNYHGFDVRDPTQQDRVDSFQHRRGRGRGTRGGGRRPDGVARGRGRGRRLQEPLVEDGGGGGDQRGQERFYRNFKPTRTNYREEQDFPELPSVGDGDQRHSPKSESVRSYAERARGQRYKNQPETEVEGVRITYQSEKTYYEKDSVGHREESYRNVTADYRYKPSVNRSVNAHAYRHTETQDSESDQNMRPRVSKDLSFGDPKQFYQLEFVNRNYQNETDNKSKVSQTQEDDKNEEINSKLSEPELKEGSRKAYSSERHQRSRPLQDPSALPESSPTEADSKDDIKPLLNIHNLKIQVKGSERLVQYRDNEDQEEEDGDTLPEDNEDEEGEEQRMDKRERSRPKRYSSQRQRGQDQSSSNGSQYYREGMQSQSPISKAEGSGSHGNVSQRSSSQRGPAQTSVGRQAPSSHTSQGLQSSIPPNLQNLLQQGMMLPPDGTVPHGVRPPHLPSPAFFQQHQGNIPPPYYVGPMVNYGTPQYPMGAPLQFQHFSMGMPPPAAQPAVPPAPAPPPQSPAGPPPSSSQNPSVQQVGGVTYYSPMQQPLQIRHPPPKRQSKPLTIESPPEVHLR
ncbi:uncharacterized protein [Apostichopus japonicus]|uniref:uncharacterized protein isoform X2 n=1 Tax=Stichopus japonicus TaxID=307972 RepID=UPI003AB17279